MTVSPTTRPSKIDVSRQIPTLADFAVETIRLHPRRSSDESDLKSKFGGAFRWPIDAPWPTLSSVDESYDENTPLIPLLQIDKRDFPAFDFAPGTNLMHLLWTPVAYPPPIFIAKSFVYWWDQDKVDCHQVAHASPGDFVPQSCTVNPESVVEYPVAQELPKHILYDVVDRILEIEGEQDEDIALEIYDCELSSCPSTKLGGSVAWIQEQQRPKCRCGNMMDHLLTISSQEFDKANYVRWCPAEEPNIWEKDYEERIVIQRPLIDRISGRQFIFCCKDCPEWPISSVFQS